MVGVACSLSSREVTDQFHCHVHCEGSAILLDQFLCFCWQTRLFSLITYREASKKSIVLCVRCACDSSIFRVLTVTCNSILVLHKKHVTPVTFPGRAVESWALRSCTVEGFMLAPKRDASAWVSGVSGGGEWRLWWLHRGEWWLLAGPYYEEQEATNVTNGRKLL